MTQGLRNLRALGVGLGLLVGSLSGCLHQDKKPVSPAPRRNVGPSVPGGGTMSPTSPTSPTTTRPAPSGGVAPSVQPSASNFGTSNRMNSTDPSLSMGAQAGYQPPTGVPPRPVNPATFAQPTGMPSVTAQPATNFQSRGQMENDMRMTAQAPPSGMPGATGIPMGASRLNVGQNPDMDLNPPPAPGTAMAGLVQPPTSSLGGFIPPSRPADLPK